MNLDPARRAWLGSAVISLERIATLALVVATTAAAAPASAAETDRSRAVELIRAAQAQPEHKALVSALVARSEQALRRADGARRAGDHTHGGALEALALELAATARDLVRTVEAEQKLQALEKRAIEADTRAVRARALVEQTAARRGRAAAELAALEAERKPEPAVRSAAPAKPAAPASKPQGAKPQGAKPQGANP